MKSKQQQKVCQFMHEGSDFYPKKTLNQHKIGRKQLPKKDFVSVWTWNVAQEMHANSRNGISNVAAELQCWWSRHFGSRFSYLPMVFSSRSLNGNHSHRVVVWAEIKVGGENPSESRLKSQPCCGFRRRDFCTVLFRVFPLSLCCISTFDLSGFPLVARSYPLSQSIPTLPRSFFLFSKTPALRHQSLVCSLPLGPPLNYLNFLPV